MSEPAVFDQNVLDSWFFHRWKEQSLSFKNNVLTNLFDKIKGFKTEIKNKQMFVWKIVDWIQFLNAIRNVYRKLTRSVEIRSKPGEKWRMILHRLGAVLS